MSIAFSEVRIRMRKQEKSNSPYHQLHIHASNDTGSSQQVTPRHNDTRNVYLALSKIPGVSIITISNIFKAKIDSGHKQYWC